MILVIYIQRVFLALLFLSLHLFFSDLHVTDSIEKRKIEHHIRLAHPGNENQKPSFKTLVEIRGKDGMSESYYMDVESVICAEEVCKVVEVRLFWNALGVYQKYELAKSITLEKYDGIEFLKEDYHKLDSILSSTQSPFKEVSLEELVNKEKANDVDAVSGATIIELATNETIDGATLTCYTLWHWVHGGVVQLIREFTAINFDTGMFLEYLKNKKADYQLFALEQMAARRIYDEQLILEISKQLKQTDILVKPAIYYLETLPKDKYYETVKTLIKDAKGEDRKLMLVSLLKSNQIPPVGFYEKMCEDYPDFRDLQETVSFLTLINSKNVSSPNVNDFLINQLNNDFLIARSIYWFLTKQSLDQVQEEQLKTFYEINKGSL